ncbi:helix-turn-helix domain-containing protein [Draconibacterium halophilum]|uniref:Helix-turn-helix domain-containing protein n=1 Tax=Draconibacterium halophilum TaxID=2706887 RepID=A0A6C0R7U8_9BACT|nr:XRE family transcriptional regulator [Draconibacterium halophilum]QIA06250.1 helix-turn-helix domain-containing protein [Draconibacterium halophilum]
MKNRKKIGSKIKEFREFRQLSREDLALQANLDEGQLQLIEDEGNVPSLGVLIKISRAMGVRIGTFLDDQETIGPALVNAGNAEESLSFSTKDESTREHLNFFSLAQAKAGRHMEPFLVEIEPSEESDYKLSSHEGEEFLYILDGSVEINYGKEVYLLHKGDTIYLDSVVAHNIHAAGEQAAKILAVVYTPV